MITAVLVALLVPVVVWMLVLRQIPGPPTPPLAVPSPAPKVSAAEALQKGNTAYEQQDYTEAMRWFRKAADQGNADAPLKIGVLYGNGWGVAEDDAEAMRWFRKAADQGNTGAQVSIGWAYGNGLGVARDNAEAMRWYRKAADQGNAEAQAHIKKMKAQ